MNITALMRSKHLLPALLFLILYILCGSCQSTVTSPGNEGDATKAHEVIPSAGRTEDQATSRTFEIDAELPRQGSAADLYQLALEWFADTTFLSPVSLQRSRPDSLVLIGTGSGRLGYQAGEGPNALRGYGKLTYDIRVFAKDGGYRLIIDGARINGVPPQNDTCWIPCKTYEYPRDRSEGFSREYREAMWWQMRSGVETQLKNIPGLFQMWTMTHGGPPAKETTP